MAPRCPNGHEGGASLKCAKCGAQVSYRDSLSGLANLPAVEADFGKASVLSVGIPSAGFTGDYSGSLGMKESKSVSLGEFGLETVPGATWYDLYSPHVAEVSKWLRLIEFAKSKYKFLVMDASNPLSVLAVASIPREERTLVLAISADGTCTPLQQNTSYAAVISALRKEFQVIVFPQTYVDEGVMIDETGTVSSKMGAFTRTVSRLLAKPDDLVDLVEGDRPFGVGLHMASTLTTGSNGVYGSITNAVSTRAFQLPDEVRPGDIRTLHSIVWCEGGTKAEFERELSELRKKSFNGVIRSEFRFREKADLGSYDFFTIYGMSEPGVLQASIKGYTDVAEKVPTLGVGRVK